MVFRNSGKTAYVDRQKTPKAAIFEKITSKPLAKREKTRYSLTACDKLLPNKRGSCRYEHT